MSTKVDTQEPHIRCTKSHQNAPNHVIRFKNVPNVPLCRCPKPPETEGKEKGGGEVEKQKGKKKKEGEWRGERNIEERERKRGMDGIRHC